MLNKNKNVYLTRWHPVIKMSVSLQHKFGNAHPVVAGGTQI